jgi:sensor histidine kinase YesM
MNPHFIFNCLNSINSYIVKSKPEEASMYVTKFSRLIRLILDNSRTSFITLEKELAALRLYIDMENLRFNNTLKYELIVGSGLDHVPVPPMIIQPFVENAIWHGLLHSNKPGFLEIEISELEEYLICTIADNGIGRQAAAEQKSKSSLKKKSLGMEVTLKRLNSFNGSLPGESNMLVEDLTDDKEEPAGTRVTIKIKIHHDKLRNQKED